MGSDSRVSLVYQHRDRNFSLHLRLLRESDSGVYECQLSTSPLQTITVNLSVTDIPNPAEINKQYYKDARNPPKSRGSKEVAEVTEATGASAKILGPANLYVHPHSLVNMTCVVNTSPPPQHVF